MSAVSNYDNFMANSGAGLDAAGRRVYGSHIQYGSDPRSFAKDQMTEAQLRQAATYEDPGLMRLRELIEENKQLRQSLGVGPGTTRLPVYPAEGGKGTTSYDFSYRQGSDK